MLIIFVGIDPFSDAMWNQVRCIKLIDADDEDFVYYDTTCKSIPVAVTNICLFIILVLMMKDALVEA